MKIVYIIILILMATVVFADEFSFNTDINISIDANLSTTSLRTESSEYSFSCLNNQTTTKTITIRRNVSVAPTAGCAYEVNQMALTCNRTTARIDELIKESNGYSDLYIKCNNDLTACKVNEGYKAQFDTCNTERTTCNTNLQTVNTELNSVKENLKNCESDSSTCKEDLDAKYEWYESGGAGLIVGILGYIAYTKWKKRSPKSKREESGMDIDDRER